MKLIAQLTGDCPREDCAVQEGGSTSTCLGWTPTYDKRGERTDRGNPNSMRTSFRCSTCGKEWAAYTQYDETTFTIVKGAK